MPSLTVRGATALLCATAALFTSQHSVGAQVVFGGDDKITPEVVCHACGATIKEIEKVLKLKAGSRRSESDVMDAVAGICTDKSFKIYDYPPPKMIKACQKLMDDHDEDFESAFMKKPALSTDEIEAIVCKKPCKNVDKTKPASTMMGNGASPDVYMDGVPVKTNTQRVDSGAQPSKKKRKKKSKKKKRKKKKKKTEGKNTEL